MLLLIITSVILLAMLFLTVVHYKQLQNKLDSIVEAAEIMVVHCPIENTLLWETIQEAKRG